MAPRPQAIALPSLTPWEWDRETVEQELRSLIGPPLRSNPLQSCMDYAALGAGQRIRPLLALRIGRLCGAPDPLVLRAGAAIELLHAASLIVDDLPSMDNSPMRRGRPSAHVAFGEATATLAAFGMVALAARCITEQECARQYAPAQQRFQHALLRTLDVASLIGGQMLDLELTGAQRDSQRANINDLKTVPLFLLAVEAGTAYAAAPPYPLLKKFGREYGAAFQLTDDYLDGELADPDRLHRQFQITRDCLAPFGADAQQLRELVDYLEERASS